MMQKRKSQAILLYACGATWWPNFSQVQVAPPGYLNLVAIRYLQLWCQPMGPLCLWQCLSSLATVHIQERIWVVPLHCDSIIKLHTWKCKKGPNMSRRGTNASPSEYSASMPLQLHWMLNHVLEVHWGAHTYRCSTAVMSNLSHNTFAPYHWPQPLVLFSQGGRSNTSRSYWRQNAAERCIRSYWAGGYHGSIGATLKCATADQN